MPIKFLDAEFFMTKDDERVFSDLVSEEFPDVIFFENYLMTENNPTSKKNLGECTSDEFGATTLLFTHILTEKEFKSKYINFLNGYYRMANVGNGIATFSHSKINKITPKGLTMGRIIGSYDSFDPKGLDVVFKELRKILRRNGRKVCFLDSITKEPNPDIVYGNTYAWPDAIEKFDQVDGNYLNTQGSILFTTKYDPSKLKKKFFR